MHELKPVYYWIELFFTSLIIVTLSISMIFLVAGLSGAITQIVIDRKAMRTWAANWEPPNVEETILKTTTLVETTTFSASVFLNTTILNVTNLETTAISETTVESAENTTVHNLPTTSVPVATTLPFLVTLAETTPEATPKSTAPAPNISETKSRGLFQNVD